ncbi:cardiolipin synthase [Wenzhouxiangella sp. AB-CW3]|uniref:cardiolipin synthase n=1 Tax=Wenzhouxiangella sp. AB-CW3 TaxID=2771012 RepID=UPI00168BEC17|nr:cardiolipin synthase [Wenzhouxiangella sp. AB-CW3]QOC22045.1 cardiolipin synthase [Wenzhouxiangella sp. AB-CW3]
MIRRLDVRRTVTFSAIVLVAHLIGFATSLHALMGTRTAPGTVAWVVSLNAIPYLAVPAYLVFGRDQIEDYVQLRRERVSLLNRSLESHLVELAPFRSEWSESDPKLRALEQLAHIPFVDGNQAELLVDGKAIFASIFDGIDAAQDYLLVQFYILRDDKRGRELQQQLIRKAREGVRVYVLFDSIGSLDLSRSYISELIEAGVEVRSFLRHKSWIDRFQLNFRNHRKLVIADGKVGWIGGLNIGDEYESEGWRDAHARIEGPAVLNLQLSFLEDWRWVTEDLPAVSWQPHPVSDAGVPILIVPSGPADEFETASLMVQQFIHLAEERIWISSPYFVPDEGVVGALKLAALGGLDVRVLIPERSDSRLASLAAYRYMDALSAAGVRIFRYQPGLMHAKVFLIDDRGGAVSTVNMDNRSFRLNFELTALVADPTFAGQVERMFENDFASSREMVENEVADMPLWIRLASRAANLFAPAL